MASVRDISLSLVGSDAANTNTYDEQSIVDGWDATVLDQLNHQSAARKSGAISGNAVAHGSNVTCVSNNPESTVLWKKDFEPDRVGRVTSNSDGSIVAVSTNGGTIKLLRGRDGAVLATRRVSSSTSNAAKIFFVNGSNPLETDMLVIVAPTETEIQSQNIIVVSAINGKSLNSEEPALVADAARGMSIDALKLSSETWGEDGIISSLEGCFIDDQTVRFVVGDSQGRVSLYDYNIDQKVPATLVKTLRFQNEDNSKTHKWIFDPQIGFVIHDTSDQGSICLFSLVSEETQKICWYHMTSMNFLLEHSIELSSTSQEQPKLLALEPLRSCSCTSALALAIAFKSSDSVAGAEIHVIQSAIKIKGKSQNIAEKVNAEEDTDEERILSLSQPKCIYKIPQDPSLTKSVVGIDLAAISNIGPYSFRYGIKYDTGSDDIKEFVSSYSVDKGGVAGRFRLYLSQGEFDQADELLASEGSSESRPLASLHGSEVAVSRLQHMLLKNSSLSQENMIEAKECLQRLAIGAVSGGEIGVKCLIDASSSLSEWPMSLQFTDIGVSGKASGPPIGEFRMALSAMSTTIASALKSVMPAHEKFLKGEKTRIDNQCAAMQCIESMMDPDGDGLLLSPPFSSIESIPQLFRVLVSSASFTTAERVQSSDWGEAITAEVVASSILGIATTTDPRLYVRWLENKVIANLSINHQLLKVLQAWTCRTADDLDDQDNDEDKCGLDSSILLLEAVHKATVKLHTIVHSSFASYSPFIEEQQQFVGYQPPSTISESLDSSRDSSLSFDSSSPRASSFNSVTRPFSRDGSRGASIEKQANPTILQLGLRGAARKAVAKTTISALSSRLSNTSRSMSTLDPRRRNLDTVDDFEKLEEEHDDDCVEQKLRHSKELKMARAIGLVKQKVSLREYSAMGGARFVATELVEYNSKNASTDNARQQYLCEGVKPFCDFADVDFDVAITNYCNQLCDNHKSNLEVLEEAASLSRCCSSSHDRCQIALKVLRSALLCNSNTSCWSALSNDATEWAVDDEMRSEIEEATRLLVIDGIVRRYCGNAARDFFRVSNPHHGLKLVHHVCRHIDNPSVLSDVFALCDAFSHIARSEACVLILQRLVFAPERSCKEIESCQKTRAEQCTFLLEKINAVDPRLAHTVGSRAISFCMDTINECSASLARGSKCHQPRNMERCISASSAACSMLAYIHDISLEGPRDNGFKSLTFATLGSESWLSLLREVQRIAELQSLFSIFVSLTDLRTRSRHNEIAMTLLRPARDIYLPKKTPDAIKKLRSVLIKAKRGFELLIGDDEHEIVSVWCTAIGATASFLATKADEGACDELLEASNVLDDISSVSAFQSVVNIAMSHCKRASKEVAQMLSATQMEAGILTSDSIQLGMRCMARASSLLEEHALIFCPQELLASMVTLANLTETVSQLLVRADGGSGESIEQFQCELDAKARTRRDPSSSPELAVETKKVSFRIPSAPILHASWYIGDGLLLPPLEALMYCLEYCQDTLGMKIMKVPSDLLRQDSIYSFLASRGAHTMELRMLSCSASIGLSQPNQTRNDFTLNQSAISFEDSVRALAERSLGGSGNGITSGTIDSQLAVSHLLSLPVKLAFKVYRASLPTAISRRDFSRVLALSNIGVFTGKGGAVVGWKNQATFVVQCQRLSSNSIWWKVLKSFGVPFDPRSFDESKTSKKDEKESKTSKSAVNYVASLVPLLIHNASLQLGKPHYARELALRFVRTYKLDPHFAAQKHIEFMLSWPGDTLLLDKNKDTGKVQSRHSIATTKCGADPRIDLALCETTVKDSLQLLPSGMARSAVLRRCLVSLENLNESGYDYERYSVILFLYQCELSAVVSARGSSKKVDDIALQQELERVERRQDALAILSSFFHGDRINSRPHFPSFFLPLPKSFKLATGSGTAPLPFCGVLGATDPDTAHMEMFDPLSPLHDFLTKDPGTATATALAPLCHSLGIPSGYIHARSLIQRFLKSKIHGTSMPLFETNVKPIINRLHSARDASELSEWCATQCDKDEKECLKNLELALTYAIKASKEAEQQRSQNGIEHRESIENERRALEAVKRISSLKATLSDKLRVENILLQDQDKTVRLCQADKILSKLTHAIHHNPTQREGLSPESFVESLLVDASLATAEACLDSRSNFTISHFRKVATRVHEGCKNLANQYSHVHAGNCARVLARRWLMHGDEVSKKGASDAGKKSSSSGGTTKHNFESHHAGNESMVNIDEDETVDFVMDLNALGEVEEVWSEDVGPTGSSSEKNNTVISQEEPSALKSIGSSRESSDFSVARVALRIAFVVSFADGYHATNDEDNTENLENKKLDPKQNETNKSKPGLSRIALQSAHPRRDSAMKHANDLLRIVFARSGGAVPSSLSKRTPLKSLSSTSGNLHCVDESSGAHADEKTVTFSMRHRALRAASVLCPQAALQRVIDDSCYFNCSNGESICTLSKCVFGSFVAMEIEAMGLQLPHSDLVQLSTMHFPSYARALWRHRSPNNYRGFKGRFLLLLLEMSTKDGIVTDATLIISVLSEMLEMELPRTLLSGCECIAKLHKHKESLDLLLSSGNGKSIIFKMFKKVSLHVFAELGKNVSKTIIVDDCLATVNRLGNVVVDLFLGRFEEENVLEFIKVLANLVSNCTNDNKALSGGLLEIAVNIACAMPPGERRASAFSGLAIIPGGKELVKAQFCTVLSESKRNIEDTMTASDWIQEAETLFVADIAAAVHDD